jgi:thiamine biosynthesis lipoprotein
MIVLMNGRRAVILCAILALCTSLIGGCAGGSGGVSADASGGGENWSSWGSGSQSDKARDSEQASSKRFEFAQPHMGTTFKIVLYAENQEIAAKASDAAFARIKELNGILSHYDSNSELSQLGRLSGTGKSMKISDEFWLVLNRSVELSARSGGAFDVTIGPFMKLWRRSRRQHELPAKARIEMARASVGFDKIKLEAKTQSAQLAASGMQLDLGGIAKGYAGDEALKVLREHGIKSALVDAGGDVVAGDAPPGRAGWRVGIVPLDSGGKPSRLLIVTNQAVATSGDAFQYVVIEGVRYSHLMNPKTGLGITDHSRVTIVAPDGITADSLASAVSVLGPVEGLKLVDQTKDVAGHILRAPDGKIQQYESKRFKTLKQQAIPRQ